MKTVARILAVCFVASIASAASPHAYEIPGKNVTVPQVLREVKPDYTPEAKKQGIQGRVEMRR